MPITLKLEESSFKRLSELVNQFEFGKNSEETSHGKQDEQIIPSLYLCKTDDVEVYGGVAVPKGKVKFQDDFPSDYEDVLAMPGYCLKIISFKSNVVFLIEELDNLLLRNYKVLDNKFYPFLVVNRSDILGYEKQSSVSMYAVKAKKAIGVGANTRGAGGLVGHLLIKGVTKAISKLEDDLKMKQGVKYKLSFRLDGQDRSIYLVAEPFIVGSFDRFLSGQWSTAEPQVTVTEKKKEGCYIATLCYKSYDHPDVVVLRKFRDNYLLKRHIGIKMVELYYRYSPALVAKIKNYHLLNFLIKKVVLRPLVQLLK